MGLTTVPPKEPALLAPTMKANMSEVTANGTGDAIAKNAEEINGMLNGAAKDVLLEASDVKTKALDDLNPEKGLSSMQSGESANNVPAKPADQAKSVAMDIKDMMSDFSTSCQGVITKARGGGVINVKFQHTLSIMFGLFVLSSLLLVRILRPSPLLVGLSTLLGVGAGLGLSFIYYYNKKNKEEERQMLGMHIGLKGLQTLLGNLPSWLSFTETEKMEWMNGLLEEVWPYVDRGVCKMVKSQTETLFADMLKQMSVPGLRSITFKHLTFGDAPFRVESIKVKDDYSEYVEMEVAVRWCGDANITMAIELAGITASNKICPRVTDISFSAVARVRFQPLVDVIPGFGAMSMTFQKPPQYKYRMNFGAALGGSTAANIVQPFVNSVANEVINNMLVWPQRLVVPLYWNDPHINREVEKMSYRPQGVMKVTVVSASDLKAADIGGRSDPVVELTTDGRYIPCTTVKPKTLAPVWNESFWVVVHEPDSQSMKVWVSDVDLFSAKDLVTLNLSNTFGSKEFIGRTLVDLAPITEHEGEAVEKEYNLGEGSWSRPEGCGKGMGKIKVSCLYRSFGHIRPAEVQTADVGILNIMIRRVQKMNRQMTILVSAKVAGQSFSTGPVTNYQGGDHVFYFGHVKDFYGVPFDASVKLTVYERSLVGDDVVGGLEMVITDVAMAVDKNILTGVNEAGFFDRTLKLEDADSGQIHVQLRYMPYF